MAWEQRRKQELELVKRLPPELVLDRLQIPWKWVGSQIMAQAVWRGERHPSVSIQQRQDTKHWVWHDHGTGEGGSWIDLLQVARGLSYVEAVRTLRSWMREVWGADFDLLSLSENSEPRKRPLSVSYSEVKHPALKAYLRRRGIRVSDIPPWLREVHWEMVNEETGELKHYFGLGVRTVGGGWQVRNPLWKGVVGPGGPAVAAGETFDNERKPEIVVVEGLFDALAVRQVGVGRNFLILGGSGNITTGAKLIEELRPRRVILALDRDEAGNRAEQALLRHLAALDLELLRLDLGPYKDPADALTAGWSEWNLIEMPHEVLTRKLSFPGKSFFLTRR